MKLLEEFKESLAKPARGRLARPITLTTKEESYITNYARSLPTKMSRSNRCQRINHAKRFLVFVRDKPRDKQTIDGYLDQFKKDTTKIFVFGVVKEMFRTNGLEKQWPYRKGETPQTRQSDVYSPALDPELIKMMIQNRNKLTDSEACFLALSTIYGLRRIEMSTITSEDVKLEDNAIFIHTAKGGRERWHKIPEQIKPYLTKHNFDTRFNGGELTVMFWEILKKNNLKSALSNKRIGWHAIRRTVVTLLIRSGLDPFLVKDFLRWKGPPTQGLDMPAHYYATSWVGLEGIKPIITGTEADIEIFKKHPFLEYWNTGEIVENGDVSKEDKRMARYWVNLGHWETDFEEESEQTEKRKRVRQELEDLATGVSGDIFPSLVYKTEDLDEAIRIREKAKSIIRAEGFSDELVITRQPECPACGYLGRFSDQYCPRCGTKLTPQEEVD